MPQKILKIECLWLAKNIFMAYQLGKLNITSHSMAKLELYLNDTFKVQGPILNVQVIKTLAR